MMSVGGGVLTDPTGSVRSVQLPRALFQGPTTEQTRTSDSQSPLRGMHCTRVHPGFVAVGVKRDGAHTLERMIKLSQ
ncbi:hypothetical protein NDU88_003899 [Pleurodeles waltl]|uniref:Uncharacterized protein n=1 Tax=Pleurodeles waltl TaxID=8319 RepID=A0AAV7TPZ6_PLEWA|nr:hypothetical protein NDU88_003899 [Pleurodeles waltl]